MSKEQICEIEQQLLNLNTQKLKLLAEQEASEIEDFRKLEWTHEYDAFLKINSLVCAGLPSYYIMIPALSRQDCTIGRFRSSDHIFVFGDEKKPYEYNITYKRYEYNQDYPCFTTSCDKRLIEFLQRVKFKSVNYDERTLAVLLAAKAANG